VARGPPASALTLVHIRKHASPQTHTQGVNGAWVQTVLDEVHITLNKNSVPGDKSAMTPGGIRIGTPALTTRGMGEADFVAIAGFLDRAVKITVSSS
jgi:glycine hydroxymethyltransferase